MWSLSQWQWPRQLGLTARGNWPLRVDLTQLSHVMRHSRDAGLFCMCLCACVCVGGGALGWFGCVPLGDISSSGATDTINVFCRLSSVSFAVRLRVTLVYIWVSGMRAGWQMGAGKLCLVNIITGQWAQILSGSWTGLHTATESEREGKSRWCLCESGGFKRLGGEMNGKWVTDKEKGTETEIMYQHHQVCLGSCC